MRGRVSGLRCPIRRSIRVPRSAPALKPSGLMREAGEFFEKETGIKNAFHCLRTHKQITKIPRDHWLAEFKPFFHRTLNNQTDDYKKTAGPAEAAADFAMDKRNDAMMAFFATVPTTIDGMRTKIDFARNMDPTDWPNVDQEGFWAFMETLYESALAA
jgi:hypothetical protein